MDAESAAAEEGARTPVTPEELRQAAARAASSSSAPAAASGAAASRHQPPQTEAPPVAFVASHDSWLKTIMLDLKGSLGEVKKSQRRQEEQTALTHELREEQAERFDQHRALAARMSRLELGRAGHPLGEGAAAPEARGPTSASEDRPAAAPNRWSSSGMAETSSWTTAARQAPAAASPLAPAARPENGSRPRKREMTWTSTRRSPKGRGPPPPQPRRLQLPPQPAPAALAAAPSPRSLCQDSWGPEPQRRSKGGPGCGASSSDSGRQAS